MSRVRAVLVDQALSAEDNVVAALLKRSPSDGDASALVDEFWSRELYNGIFDVPVEYYVQHYPIQADIFTLLSQKIIYKKIHQTECIRKNSENAQSAAAQQIRPAPTVAQ